MKLPIYLSIGFIFFSLALSANARADADVLPTAPTTLPFGLGVNIHFTHPRPGEMKMLADAGFTFVRMDFDWAKIERQPGKYDWSDYEALLKALDSHHIRAVFILDYANPLYDDNRSPDTDAGREAFARWAVASARHFHHRGILWEMYNEPNIHPFWRPKPNPDDYVKLASTVGKALRAGAPDAIYIGPACSTMDFKFLETCFKGGLLEYWRAVSVHPYRGEVPETVAEDYRKLRELIGKYAPKGKSIPIYSGEWGYSAIGGINPDEQGRRLARQFLTNISNGIPLSIWYDWHDDGPDPKENEHHFGTVAYPYHKGRSPVYDPKPAYFAAKTLTTQLRGYRFDERIKLDHDDDYVLHFSDGQDVKLVAWTTAKQAHPVTIPHISGEFTIVSCTGQTEPAIRGDANGLAVELDASPKYLTPAASAPAETEPRSAPRNGDPG
jgi:hypothetical protein